MKSGEENTEVCARVGVGAVAFITTLGTCTVIPARLRVGVVSFIEMLGIDTEIFARLAVGTVAFVVASEPKDDATVGFATSTLDTLPTSMIGNVPGSTNPVALGVGSEGTPTSAIENSGAASEVTGFGITSTVTLFVDRLLIVFVVILLILSGFKVAIVGRSGFVNIRGRVGFTKIGLMLLV